MYNGSFLADLRLRALRRGVWFRVLDRTERGILSLASRVVDRVGSSLLGRVLVGIVEKLIDALKGEFQRLLESFGCGRVRVVVGQAGRLGSGVAQGWLGDEGFASYLTVLEFNASPGWGL